MDEILADYNEAELELPRLRLQRGCGVRGWGRDGLGTGARGRGARARRALMSTTRQGEHRLVPLSAGAVSMDEIREMFARIKALLDQIE